MSTTLGRWLGAGARVVLRAVAVGALAGLGPATAAAQVAPVEPYWAVVVTPDTLVRSGDRDLYYPVARAGAGQLLRVDGEGGGWSRVEYPRGLTAFIPTDAVTVDPGGKTVTLKRPEKPRAARLDATRATGSWRTLGDTPLPAGTTLTLAHPATLEDAGGKWAYRVIAPATARAYVPTAALKKATPQEIDAYLASIAPPGQTPIAQKSAEGTPQPRATEPPAGITEAPAPREPSLLERLDAAYEAVRQQPTEQAELTELLAEYEKALAEMPETPFNERTRQRLRQRIEVLRLRLEYQQQLLAIAETKPKLDEATERAARALAELEKVRQYTVVGRLSASAIYDGKRMPLLYRIQSVGSPLPRTIAYVRPDRERLDPKVGQLVGVIGEASMDPDLKLRIIVPTRVDVLQAAATPQPPSGS
jgi:hypothetical protein